MPYRVVLTADAANDFRRLDGSLKETGCPDGLDERISLCGLVVLANKTGLNLTGYYKLYVAKKSIRIWMSIERRLDAF